MNRSLPCPLATVGLAAVLLATGLSACSSSSKGSATTTTSAPPATVAPTTAAPTTTPATTAAPAATTTTVFVPAAPATTPDGAAGALVAYWSKGNRAAAATVAAPAAVSAMFAVAYPGQANLQARGCTDASTLPGTCTYRNLSSGSLYQFGVNRGRSGWYVYSFLAEN